MGSSQKKPMRTLGQGQRKFLARATNERNNQMSIEAVTTALQVNATTGNGETSEHKLQVQGCFSSQSFWKAGSARNVSLISARGRRRFARSADRRAAGPTPD